MMSAAPVLNILKDGESVKTLPVEGDLLLGRGEGCVIRLDDRAISRQHALFRLVAGGVQVEKKSEFAPLSVNGVECTRAILKDGDVISIGPYQVRLNAEKAALAQQNLQQPMPQVSPVLAETPMLGVVPTDPAPIGDLPVISLQSSSESIASAPESLSQDKGNDESNKDTLELASFEGEALETEHSTDEAQTKPVELDGIESSELIAEDAKTKVGLPTQLAVKLVFQKGAANVEEFLIEKDEVIIGRGSVCDIILNDKKSSRRHSAIRRSGMSFIIKDLESGNGTYVNGVKIQEHELSGDDVIKIGSTEFQFKAISKEYIAKEKNFMSLPDVADFMGKNAGESTSEIPLAISSDSSGLKPVPDVQEFVHAHAAAPVSMPASPVGDWIGQPIPGITQSGEQVQAGKAGKKSIIFDKFRSLPPSKQRVVAFLVIILVAAFLFLDEDEPVKPVPKKVVQKATPKKTGGSYEQLSPEDQEFVRTQYDLALSFMSAKDYDGTLDALMKVFSKVPDYKDARMYERYAIQNRQKLKAQAEEARNKKLEEEQRQKVADLVSEIRQRMEKKDYKGASVLFGDLLSLDPENPEIANWKKEIEAWEEAQRIAEQTKRVQQDINVRGWDLYKEGMGSKKQGRYYEAIAFFEQALDIGTTDKKLIRSLKFQIGSAKKLIAQRREPFMLEAKQAEESGDYIKAYRAYKKAAQADPNYKESFRGMERVSQFLHEKAKAMYTEAVLAESYSDFSTAKKKYKEILNTVPDDDIYRGRAERKLTRYFQKEE